VKAQRTAESLGTRPSTDPSRLVRQLDRELRRLSRRDGDANKNNLYRAYLDAVFARVWDAVATGAFGEIGAWVERLAGVATAFIDRNRTVRARAILTAVSELRQALRLLEHGDESLAQRGLEQQLADSTRTPAAREVMRVLAFEPNTYLKRGDIHNRMRLPDGVITAARVSQILAEFDDEGLLQRRHARVQGHEAAAHYALSSAGRELCSRLGLGALDGKCFDLRDAAAQAIRSEIPRALPGPGAHGGQLEDEHTDRAIAFCGSRGTSVLPDIARLLAQDAHEDGRYSVILIDFDLEAPRLDRTFAWEGLADCGGLARLCLDYHAVQPARRPDWLSSALMTPRYAVKCSDADYRKLWYLPTGRAAGASSAVRWSEVYDLLRSDIRRQPRNNGQPALASIGFLGDLRQALRARFNATLIEAPLGLGEFTYAATLLLASGIVKPAATDDDVMRDMLEVVENHIRWRERLHAEDKAPIMTVAATPDVRAEDVHKVAHQVAERTITRRTREALAQASNTKNTRLNHEERMLLLKQAAWQAPRFVVAQARQHGQLSETTS
jgi:hypothetical protein